VGNTPADSLYVGELPIGNYCVKAQGANDGSAVASQSYRVSYYGAVTSLVLTPPFGVASSPTVSGTLVSVSDTGAGFASNETVQISFNDGTRDVPVVQGQSSLTGTLGAESHSAVPGASGRIDRLVHGDRGGAELRRAQDGAVPRRRPADAERHAGERQSRAASIVVIGHEHGAQRRYHHDLAEA